MSCNSNPCHRSEKILTSVAIFVFATTLLSASSSHTVSPRPCDLYASTTPCVAAFSTTRALYRAYTGPLYRVTWQSDKTQRDIGLLRDGYANARTQDKFCANTSCTITKICDQSPNHNDLTVAPPGGAAHGPGLNGYDVPAVADALPATASGSTALPLSPAWLPQRQPQEYSSQRTARRRLHGHFCTQPRHEV
jgi:hypothetical protein